ncbi:MAG: hypothetical protein LBU26_01420 [Synergistaceae bacterium]|jgi:hypothetical protein|nr:hypothetical protein [Synergistaceae bacterium]
MLADATLRREGMKVLQERFGLVEAERFVALMNRESFDYTEWRRDLFDGMSVREISRMAMEELGEK